MTNEHDVDQEIKDKKLEKTYPDMYPKARHMPRERNPNRGEGDTMGSDASIMQYDINDTGAY